MASDGFTHRPWPKANGVQRSTDARGDCLIGCPLPNSSIDQWRRPMAVIVTGYTLFVTSHMTSYSRLQTNVLAKFVDTTFVFRDAGAAVGQREQ